MSKAISATLTAEPKDSTPRKPPIWDEVRWGHARQFWNSGFGHLNEKLYERIKHVKHKDLGFTI